MTAPLELEQLVAEVLLFLQQSADYAGEPSATVLRQAGRRVHRIHQRVHRSRDRYVVAIVGLGNVGKSTLLNALLGDELTPARNGPCTAWPVEFVHGTPFRVTAVPANDFWKRTHDCASAQEVRNVLNGYVDHQSPDRTSTYSRVVVELDHPLLRHNLVLADTPGFGAALSGDDLESHDSAVRAYLTDSVSQVFWVVFGEQGIGQRERLFYDELLANVCDDVIVTAREEWDDRDRSRFRDRYRPLFSEGMPTMHFVGHATEMQTEPVAERIRELQTVNGRLQSSRQALLELSMRLAEWLVETRNRPGSAALPIWNPVAWWQLSAAPECDGLRNAILESWEPFTCPV